MAAQQALLERTPAAAARSDRGNVAACADTA